MDLREYYYELNRGIEHHSFIRITLNLPELKVVFDTQLQEEGLVALEELSLRSTQQRYNLSYLGHFDKAFDTFLKEKSAQVRPKFIQEWADDIQRRKSKGKVQVYSPAREEIYDEIILLSSPVLTELEARAGIRYCIKRFEEKAEKLTTFR
ncbi:hypothetical protein HYZ97_02245 [Candidatus Pacearchaeota archaeon]|nr:hypothetical protein [Candidatus Pacearchaeota archaeon]